MPQFFDLWGQAAYTTVGFFWMALWAFCLGYLISSLIQVFVTRERMKRVMGEAGAKSVGVATFFGFISSSCSFAALSTTRALFTKGAGLVPALAFMLASTNLVVELGIVIAIFLSWQFVVGEYVGGLLLIAFMWIVVKLTLPRDLEESAREHAREGTGEEDDEDEETPSWTERIRSAEGWRMVAEKYVMEWKMVWKDVTIGFTVAGIVAVFVPTAFFETLFIGAGDSDAAAWQVLAQAVVGPLAAFFTFIGSMGNIPLAAVLYGHGVSFAGVMAFIFSDLVVFPAVRIQATYYGWKMALYIAGVLLLVLVTSAVLMHYGFALFDALPSLATESSVTDRAYFALDYGFVLNLAFGAVSFGFLGWKWKASGPPRENASGSDRILFWLSMVAYGWLAVGLVIHGMGGDASASP